MEKNGTVYSNRILLEAGCTLLPHSCSLCSAAATTAGIALAAYQGFPSKQNLGPDDGLGREIIPMPTLTGLATQLLLCLTALQPRTSLASNHRSEFTAENNSSDLHLSSLSTTPVQKPTMAPLLTAYPTASQFPTRFISHFPTIYDSMTNLPVPSTSPSKIRPSEVSKSSRMPSFRPSSTPSSEPSESIITLEVFSSSPSCYSTPIYNAMIIIALLSISLF